MSSGFPRVILTETDLSQYADSLLKGISCVQGFTEKGPISKPQLISSELQYERVFGGNLKNSDFPLLAKRALSYGAVLWVSRVAHYDDISDASTLTASSAFVELQDRATPSVPTLKVSASSPGVWGNGLKVKIVESSLDADTLFTIQALKGDDVLETISDVSMDDDSDYYIEKQKSLYFSFEDLASASGAGVDRPALGTYALSGGDDGLTGLCDADYIGSAVSRTGLYAFDEIGDALQLATPGISSPAVITAGLAYCDTRKDMVYIAETPFDLSPQEAVDFRLGRGVFTHAPFVSSHGALYYPKVKIYDAVKRKERFISPVGDVLGVFAVNDYLANESYVPAGIRRGRLINVLGVDENVGGRGRLGDGNYLCDNQVNTLCVFDEAGTVVWGAQTLQREASLLRELSVRRFMIIVKKTVAAYARAYIHQPNDPTEWRRFYRGLEPKFREWKAARCLYDYRIFCDQDANTLEEAKLNTPESVQRGEFKCQIFVKPVVGIKWVLVDTSVIRLDVDFVEAVTEVLGNAA